MPTTDTSERGLESLICTALTSAPAAAPDAHPPTTLPPSMAQAAGF